MASRRNVRYSRVGSDERVEGETEDLRFVYAPRSFDRVPWKSIALALFLLSLGSTLLFLSFFIFTGHMGGDRSQAYGLLALGFLAFLPGFYETRIAYYSWRGAKGAFFLLEMVTGKKYRGFQRLLLVKDAKGNAKGTPFKVGTAK